MKRIYCFTFFVLGLLFTGFSQENFLDKLWKAAIENNTDIILSEYNLQDADYLVRNSWKNYLPEFSIKGLSSFSGLELENDYEKIPETIDAIINIREELPGGIILSFCPSVSFSKGLADYTKESSVDNIKFTDDIHMSISYQQYLDFENLRNIFTNIEKERLLLHREIYDLNKDIKKQEVVENVTSLFINIRKNLREIDSYEKTIAFYSEWINAYDENNSDSITEKDIYQLKNTKIETEKNMRISQQNLMNLYKNLLNFINFDDFCNFFEEKKYIFCDLNNLQKKIFDENLKEKLLKNEKKLEELEYIISKKQESPVLFITTEFPIYGLDDKDSIESFLLGNKKSWELSFTIDLSKTIKGKKKEIQQSYDSACKKYEKKEENFYVSLKNERKLYKNLIENLKLQKEVLNKNIMNYSEICYGMETAYENNMCSFLDFKQSELELFIKKNECENLNDDICYLSWLLLNRTFY